MTDRERDLEEILARLEKQRPEIDRILNRPAVMDTKRTGQKTLPHSAGYGLHGKKTGNTEYEVAACSILTVMIFA